MRTFFNLLVVVFGLAAIGGWIWNIVKIFGGPPLAQWAGMEIARVIGVFVAPIGAVLGYF